MLPLIGHSSAEAVVAWRDGTAITTARYIRDVRALAALLPASVHVLNACQDRYRFAVALGAVLLAKKINLLPPTRTVETIRQVQRFAPDAICLTDQDDCTVALPQMLYPEEAMAAGDGAWPYEVPLLDDNQLVAYVFTSGSTGEPVAHRKTWAALVLNVQMEAQQLGVLQWRDAGRPCTIVGTVPAQHMYGFESTVLIALVNGLALGSGHSFYPADICASLDQVPSPRVLVTTPVHLRLLLSSGLTLPAVDLLVSATAPLAPQLALQAEQAFNTPLLEIYGCTETGQIATRRPTASPQWTLFPDLSMEPKDGRMWISGGHVELPMPMNDAIEILAPGQFLLHGRLSDLINIAGKRSSLAHLNHHLNAIEGVEDGVFYMPPEKDSGEVTRLKAFVVAPGLGTAGIMAALRQKIDPAFLPRPLYKVESLPRNSTGKLTQGALEQLAAALVAESQPGMQTEAQA